MSRKCPECQEPGARSHLPTCSFSPPSADREQFIRDNAVDLVRQKEEHIRRLAEEASKLNHAVTCARKTADRLRRGRFTPDEFAALQAQHGQLNDTMQALEVAARGDGYVIRRSRDGYLCRLRGAAGEAKTLREAIEAAMKEDKEDAATLDAALEEPHP